MVRLSQRGIDGSCCAARGVPSDLLAEALSVSQVHVNAITSRWRRAGYLAAARLDQLPIIPDGLLHPRKVNTYSAGGRRPYF